MQQTGETIIKQCICARWEVYMISYCGLPLFVYSFSIHKHTHKMPIFILIMAHNIIVCIVQCFDFVLKCSSQFFNDFILYGRTMDILCADRRNRRRFSEVFFFDAFCSFSSSWKVYKKGVYLLVNARRKDTNNSSQRDSDCYFMVVK